MAMGNSLFDIFEALAEISDEIRKEGTQVKGIQKKAAQAEGIQTEGMSTEGMQTEGIPSIEVLSEGVQTEATQSEENDYLQSKMQKKIIKKKGIQNKPINPESTKDTSGKLNETDNNTKSRTDNSYNFIDFKNITHEDILQGILFSEILSKPRSLRRGRW